MIAQPIIPGKTYRVSIGNQSTEVQARNGVQAVFLAMEKLGIKAPETKEAPKNAAN